MSFNNNVTLGELIEFLANLDQNLFFKRGFRYPHSYRGYYEDLAFEPAKFSQVREMLAQANGAMGKTFTGYKGGEYVMDKNTATWIAEHGSSGEALTRLWLEAEAELALLQGENSDA